MVDKKRVTFKANSFYESIIFILYLSIGFIPNLEAVDKIAPQWLFMSVLNLFVGIYITKNKSIFDKTISDYLKSWIIVFYTFFIIWGGLSFFYAINPTEVLVNTSRQFNVFFMFVNMSILLIKIKNKSTFFSTIITIILGIEIYAIFNQAIRMIGTSGMISSGNLLGVTANRNIAAFSIALKIPFVLYLILKFKNYKTKVVGLIITTLAITALTIIQSRASYLAVGLIIIAFLVIPFIFYRSSSTKSKLKISTIVILPLIISIFTNQLFLASKGADAVSRASTISFSTNDGSVNQRLRYYKHVLSHLKLNPILGVGLGNWKFKSIEYDKKSIIGYVVPYHAHSDFIQLGAELGIFGFLSYLGIFIAAIFLSFKILFEQNFDTDNKLFVYFILVSLSVYLIDANLNFPIARPQVLVIWCLTIGLILFHNNSIKKEKNLKNKLPIRKIVFSILLAIGLPSIFISYKVYGSLKNQMYLLRDFNSNQYLTTIPQLEAMQMDIPNVTVTTIPLKSMKARYYLKNKQYEKALAVLDQGNNANPYLFFSENLKSKIFQEKGNIDSAYHFSKKAYFGLPNNSMHVANYMKLAMQKKDKKAVELASEQLDETSSVVNWQNIITAYLDIVGFADEKLMKLTNKAVELFPHNIDLLILRKLAYTSPIKLKLANKIAEEATIFFNEGNYKQANLLYLKALNEVPMEYTYYENAANCFYQLKDFGNSLLYSSKVIYQFNPGNGKSEYLYGISKIALGDTSGGCEYLSKALNLGYKQAEVTKKKLCTIQ